MELQENDLARTAAYFVNSTGSHIFLTGKAGTGKTTFLKNLAGRTHKNYVIVAPTGIAALNAGGVTIHSMFQLPLGTFLPDRTPSGNFSSENSIYTQYTLNRKHPISSLRKQVLRSIDLLIIDEVSMLRSDVLDAIDYRMRSVKGNFQQSFGGVQVLMIGDLYQLPPIVKDHEWNYLKRYYHSAHFFESKVMQTDGFVFIELEKIYRQTDNRFIRILNNFRNNVTTTEDIQALNQYYQPNAGSDNDDVITITTHNYKADDMNRSALSRLGGKAFTFSAEIGGDFPENIYPIPERLELKLDAQIMFIKNDTSGQNKYFNGRIARVVEIDNDQIVVQMSDSELRCKLEPELWENKKYTVNAKSKELDEEIVGTFKQFPIKLAWAVTVHKSQGLTFDKAIVDVGQAFAPGQVYVALSRLRSLDGLILRTKIDPRVISSDQLVVAFSAKNNVREALNDILKEKQKQYMLELVNSTFAFALLLKEFDHFRKEFDGNTEFDDDSMRSAIELIYTAFKNEEENTAKFRYQISQLLQKTDQEQLLERLDKGSDYYITLLKSNLRRMVEHIEMVARFSGQKSYLTSIAELDQILMKKLESVEKCSHIIRAIIQEKEWNGAVELRDIRDKERMSWQTEAGVVAVESNSKSKRKTGRVRKAKAESTGKKKVKTDTVESTLILFREKLTIAEIAERRSLVPGTIEAHLSKAVASGKIQITDFVADEEISEISEALKSQVEKSMNEIHRHLEGKFSYGKLNAVAAHLKLSRM